MRKVQTTLTTRGGPLTADGWQPGVPGLLVTQQVAAADAVCDTFTLVGDVYHVTHAASGLTVDPVDFPTRNAARTFARALAGLDWTADKAAVLSDPAYRALVRLARDVTGDRRAG